MRPGKQGCRICECRKQRPPGRRRVGLIIVPNRRPFRPGNLARMMNRIPAMMKRCAPASIETATCEGVDLGDLLIEVLVMGMEPFEYRNETRRKSVLTKDRRQALHDSAAYRQTDTKLKQESVYLVARTHARSHEWFPHAMQCGQHLLRFGSRRDETHRRAGRRLSDRFRISKVVFVSFDEWPDEVRRDQLYPVSERD